jgi:hypothetical protein
VPRASIRFEGVLGQGNYGQVRLASYDAPAASCGAGAGAGAGAGVGEGVSASVNGSSVMVDAGGGADGVVFQIPITGTAVAGAGAGAGIGDTPKGLVEPDLGHGRRKAAVKSRLPVGDRCARKYHQLPPPLAYIQHAHSLIAYLSAALLLL